MNSAKQLFKGTIEDFELDSLNVTTSLGRERIKKEFAVDYRSNIDFTKKHPITKKNIFRQLFAASTYFFPLQMKTPTLIIQGLGDRFVNPSCSTDIQNKWKCQLVSHPSAGHDVAFEDGAWLIETLKANLKV